MSKHASITPAMIDEINRALPDDSAPVTEDDYLAAYAGWQRHAASFDYLDGYASVYGFPATSDPRDFLPGDPDGGDNHPSEIVRWWRDYQHAECGETVDWPGCIGTGTMHIARTRWGLGITRWREPGS